jgi:hypothetical protein
MGEGFTGHAMLFVACFLFASREKEKSERWDLKKGGREQLYSVDPATRTAVKQ